MSVRASALSTPAGETCCVTQLLCFRCRRHRGKRWHWCIRLNCDCPCRGRQ